MTFHPLLVERFGRKGWFFLSCPDIPGLSLFGPDLDDLTDNAEIAIAELLKKRGENILRVSIEPVPDDAQDAAPAWGAPIRHVATALAA